MTGPCDVLNVVCQVLNPPAHADSYWREMRQVHRAGTSQRYIRKGRYITCLLLTTGLGSLFKNFWIPTCQTTMSPAVLVGYFDLLLVPGEKLWGESRHQQSVQGCY